MSLPSIILTLCLAACASAGELPWIGVSLNPSKPEQRKEVQLPEGVGFEVSRVIKGSPLATAGGLVGDLWWKFDDQILVNKGQMVVLLRTKSPGDVVRVEFYRTGELKAFNLNLGTRMRQEVYSVSMKPKDSAASRILTKRDRVARVSENDHDLSLKREGEGWRFEIKHKGVSVLSSLVSESDLNEKIPSKWHGSFLILKLTLQQQESRATELPRPRVRYVPRAKSSEE
jgi:hypothetical protein